jgi:hypothetical protein
MTAKIPEPLKSEHKEPHAELVRATRAGGKTGDRAKTLEKLIHKHFAQEEEFALPPIGLIAALAQDKVNPKMRNVLAMTDHLKAELPTMLREHKAIVTMLKKLTATAKREKKPEHADFAESVPDPDPPAAELAREGIAVAISWATSSSNRAESFSCQRFCAFKRSVNVAMGSRFFHSSTSCLSR